MIVARLVVVCVAAHFDAARSCVSGLSGDASRASTLTSASSTECQTEEEEEGEGEGEDIQRRDGTHKRCLSLTRVGVGSRGEVGSDGGKKKGFGERYYPRGRKTAYDNDTYEKRAYRRCVM